MATLFVGSLLLAACSNVGSLASSATGSPSNEVAPSAAASTETASPEPAATPEETPEAEAKAEIVGKWVLPYKSFGTTQADVIVEVRNTGTSWIRLKGYESDYTIFDDAEGVVTTGTFSYTYPANIAPGATGYLATDLPVDGVTLDDVKRVESNIYYAEMDEADTVILEASAIQNRQPETYEGITTVGRLTNTSDERIDTFHVGAFYLDAKGKPLGYSYTNLGRNLEPAQTKGFETFSTRYLKLSDIKETRVFASNTFDF